MPLSLWLPYAIYRRSHVAHHACPRITDPLDDPESRYVAGDAAAWRRLARVQATLAGRLAFGPLLALVALARDEAARWRIAPCAVARDWGMHLLAVTPVLLWLEASGFGIARYVMLVVYPGTSLTLLRSFAEHRADIDGPARAATVAGGGALSLLFLNNNLHAAHHEQPALAWYSLPAYHRRHRARLEAGRSYRGYGEIVRRFALRPHDSVVHPDQARGR